MSYIFETSQLPHIMSEIKGYIASAYSYFTMEYKF